MIAVDRRKFDGRTNRRFTLSNIQELETLENAALVRLDAIIADPQQPRKRFDPQQLQQLADSIREHDLLQPISLRWGSEQQKWIIVAGERRFRACQLLERERIPAICMRDEVEIHRIREQQLIENLQRCDLAPCEKARSFHVYMEEHNCSAADLSRRLSIPKSSVSESLSLLHLSAEQQEGVDAGTIGLREAIRIVRDIRAKPRAKARPTKKQAKKKSRRGTEVKLQSSNGARIVVKFAKKAEVLLIREALLEAANQLQQSESESCS